MKWRTMIAAVAVTAATLPALTFAQNNPGDNGGNGGGRQRGGDNGGGPGGGGPGGGGRRNFDPAQFQQRMMDNLKEQLGASDEEWNVIQPKLQKVMEAQRDARAGGMMGMRGMMGGRRGGQGGPGGDQQPTTPVAMAAKELQDTLQNKEATPDQINAKLTAFRAARDKANADLEASRKDLKDVLTAKQEAQLVLYGMLE